jgi:hypothetical protein
MPVKRQPTPAEWAVIRARWEGAHEKTDDGEWKWLVHEVRDAMDIDITPAMLKKRCAAEGWARGGPQSVPLKSKRASPEKKGPKVRPTKAEPDPEKVYPIAVVPGVKGPEDNPGPGRPTYYKKEYAAMMDAYFDQPAFTIVQMIGDNGEVTATQVPTRFPTFERFAVSIGAYTNLLNRWEKAVDSKGSPLHPEFVESCARARNVQSALLQENGLAGDYDRTITQFALKNLAGWKDKTETEVTVTQVSVDGLNERYQGAIERAKQRAETMRAERREKLGIGPED